MRVLIIAQDSEATRFLVTKLRGEGAEVLCDLASRTELPPIENVSCDKVLLDWGRFGDKCIEICELFNPGGRGDVGVFVFRVPADGLVCRALFSRGAVDVFSEGMSFEEMHARLCRTSVKGSGSDVRIEVPIQDRLLFDTVPAMIWVKDRNNRILRANKFAAATKGMTSQEMEGKSTEELYPDEAAKYHRDDLEVIESKTPKLGIVEPYQDHTGTKRWVRTDKIPFFDSQGNAVGVIVFATDQTEQKSIEEELRYRIKLEEIISSLSTKFILVTPEEVEAAIHQALRTIGEFANVDRSYVFLASEDLSTADNSHEWCAEGIESHIHRLKNIPAGAFPWFFEQMRTSSVVHIPRVCDMPAEAAVEKEEFLGKSVQSLICVPMVAGKHLMGFLGFDSVRAEKTWSEDDIAFLRIVGEMFANALQRRKSAHYVEVSESLYGSVITSMEEGIVIQDSSGSVQTFNPSALNILGLTAEDLLGRTSMDSRWEAIREDGGPFPGEEHPSMVSLRTGQPCSNVIMGLKSKGETRWISINSQPIFSNPTDSQPSAVVASFTDITKRKHAERELLESELKYRTLFEDSRDAIIITTRNGRFIDVNQAAVDFFGYSREELLRLDALQVYAQPGVRVLFQEEIEKKGSVKDFEVKLRRKDGSEMDCLVTASLKRDQAGHVIGYQSVVRDVTERLRLQEAMLHTQKLESLGVLAGGIAHDFNNLLAVVLGNTELALEMLPPDSPSRDFLKQVEISSHRGAELCKQMLAYSGKGRFVVQPLDMNAILEEMTDLLSISVLKGAVLRFDLAKNLPAVMADATQVRQIVMNLVINASDAIGANNGTIHVRSGTAQITREELANSNPVFNAEEGLYVYLEVEDTGHGMDEQTRTRIFDPFFTTKFDGRGLGLAAVLGIVRGHRGLLRVESEKGKGSSFRVYFPCVPTRAEVPPTRSGKEDEWRGEGTILVVDDDHSVRTVVAQMVTQLGFQVLTADDGVEGLKVYRKNQKEISLVLLDMTMPRMNAEEFMTEVRQFDPAACVLLMSGYTKDDVTARFIGKGLAGFVQKPFKSSDLRDKIRGALRRTKSPAAA